MRLFRRLILVGVLSILATLIATRQPAPASDKPPQADPRLEALRAISQLADDYSKDLTLVPQNNGSYRIYQVMFNSTDDCKKACDTFKDKHIHVVHRYKQFADIMIQTGDKDGFAFLNNTPGIKWYDLVWEMHEPPPPAGSEADDGAKGTAEPIVHGGMDKLRGKGVIVAVIDSGFDFRHEAFISRAGGKPKSRALYFWDTTRQYEASKPGKPAPVTYPDGAPIGVIYSQDDLTSDLRNGDKPLGITDRSEKGHGTACAGIAAGSSDKHAGVAPAADLICVRIGDQGGSDPNAYLLGAICDWLDDIAGDRPMVISCSFGKQQGGRDGQFVEEMQLNERFPVDRKGRALCAAAGNEGFKGIHAQAVVTADKPGKLEWETKAEKSTSLSIYVDSAAKDDVKLELPDDSKISLRVSYMHALSNSLVFVLDLPKGKGNLSLSTKADKKFRIDAYLPTADEANQAKFVGSCCGNKNQVLSPGCATCAITVGSYDFNADFNRKDKGAWTFFGNPFTKERMEIGKLSYYSNAGFLRARDQAIKPDVVAPGQWHIAPAAEKGDDEMLDTSGKYQAFNGTSAATPYAAGVIALMMEKKPDLTVKEIRQLFEKYASKDKFTGDDLPNDHWGYGKLDSRAIKKMLEAIK